MKLVRASSLSLDALCGVISASFCDYLVPLHLTVEQLSALVMHEHVDLCRSVVAVGDGGGACDRGGDGEQEDGGR